MSGMMMAVSPSSLSEEASERAALMELIEYFRFNQMYNRMILTYLDDSREGGEHDLVAAD